MFSAQLLLFIPHPCHPNRLWVEAGGMTNQQQTARPKAAATGQPGLWPHCRQRKKYSDEETYSLHPHAHIHMNMHSYLFLASKKWLPSNPSASCPLSCPEFEGWEQKGQDLNRKILRGRGWNYWPCLCRYIFPASRRPNRNRGQVLLMRLYTVSVTPSYWWLSRWQTPGAKLPPSGDGTHVVFWKLSKSNPLKATRKKPSGLFPECSSQPAFTCTSKGSGGREEWEKDFKQKSENNSKKNLGLYQEMKQKSFMWMWE